LEIADKIVKVQNSLDELFVTSENLRKELFILRAKQATNLFSAKPIGHVCPKCNHSITMYFNGTEYKAICACDTSINTRVEECRVCKAVIEYNIDGIPRVTVKGNRKIAYPKINPDSYSSFIYVCNECIENNSARVTAYLHAYRLLEANEKLELSKDNRIDLNERIHKLDESVKHHLYIRNKDRNLISIARRIGRERMENER